MTEATKGRRRPRTVLTIDPTAAADLAGLAAVRYGGIPSRAVDACIAIGTHVLGDVSTHAIADPIAALNAWCSSRGDPAD